MPPGPVRRAPNAEANCTWLWRLQMLLKQEFVSVLLLPRGGRRLTPHFSPKIPVWWRRTVLPSLPWVVCFLSFFLYLKIPVWWRRAVLPSLPWFVCFLSFFYTHAVVRRRPNAVLQRAQGSGAAGRVARRRELRHSRARCEERTPPLQHLLARLAEMNVGEELPQRPSQLGRRRATGQQS